MDDILLYGKKQIKNIVGLEVGDDHVELFKLDENSNIVSEFHPYRHFLLANERIDKSSFQLEGDLHYKYANTYKTKHDFLSARSRLKHRNKADVWSIFDSREQAMVKDGYAYYLGLKPKDIPILSFDIETTGLDARALNAKVLLISNTFRKNGVITKKLFSYENYETCEQMLLHWCEWVREIDPSIICGHNIYGYDLDYMLTLAAGNLPLGRDGSNLQQFTYDSVFRVDGSSRDVNYKRVRIYGREIVDTLFLSYRYDIATKKYDTYGLKNIIKQEGLEKEGRVFYDAAKIKDNYKNLEEWEKIKEYAKDDADDSLALFDLMANAQFYWTQSVPKSFQQVIESATGAQINGVLLRSYLQEKHSIPKATEIDKFEGAISFGNSGIYSNVKKVDISSLYPSIILQYEVYDEQKDPRRNFLNVISKLTSERLKNKKLAKETGDPYYSALEQAQKIAINSGYGFMGTAGLNFNSIKKAEFITKKGREILNIAIDWAASRTFKIVNADTDSISYCKADHSPFTKEEQISDLNEINSLYPEKIRFEDDGYFKRFIVVAAKNYIMLDENNKLKIKGASLKATTKEPALKELINSIIKKLLEDKLDELPELYQSYVNEIHNIKDISRWCSKKSLSTNTYSSERANETKIIDAIKGTDYVLGDKIYTYFKKDGSLGLREKWDNDHDCQNLLGKLHDTASIFSEVVNTKEMFPNYSLKRELINFAKDYPMLYDHIVFGRKRKKVLDFC